MKKIILFMLIMLSFQISVSAATLPAGSIVMVQSTKMIDADDVKLGDTVEFIVIQSVKLGDDVIIKSGEQVLAKVVKRKNNFIFGVPGEINVGDFQIVKPNNEVIRLRWTIVDKGDNRYWANFGWFFVFPILFIKGDDGKIQMNSSHILYTIEDINL